MAKKEIVDKLNNLAFKQRVKLIELCGTYTGPIHLGGDLSMTDVLIALYHYGMKIDPKNISSGLSINLKFSPFQLFSIFLE